MTRNKQPQAPGSQRMPPERVLALVASKLRRNYARIAPELHGGRIYFVVGKQSWTLLLEPEGPRLFRGTAQPDDKLPFLQVIASETQLAGLFTGELDPERAENRELAVSGNSEALYLAIGACL